MDEGKASFLSVFKSRGFSNLWFNQILVQLAYNALNFTLIIWVYKLTNSNTAVSTLLFAVYLPAVIFGMLAGVFVDITDRKRVIMAVNLLLAIAFASLIFTQNFYPAILLTAFFVNTMAQFYIPAESSSIPLVVRRNQLLVANSLLSITLFSSFLVGFGLAGPLISQLGVNSTFGLGAILLFLAFIIAWLFLPSITTPINEEGRALQRALNQWSFKDLWYLTIDEIRRTLRLVSRRLSILAAICIMAGVQTIIGVMAVLIPSFLERVIRISATDASLVLVLPLGLGMVVGGILVGKKGYLLPKRKIVGSAILTAGVLLSLVGLAPIISPAIQHFPTSQYLSFIHQPPLSTVLAIGSFLLGMCLVAILVPSQTVIQESTPEQDRGKVFAVLAVAMSALSLIPVLLTGILADLVGPLPIFLAMGGTIALIGWFALRPSFFFERTHLPSRFRDFLGEGHWRS